MKNHNFSIRRISKEIKRNRFFKTKNTLFKNWKKILLWFLLISFLAITLFIGIFLWQNLKDLPKVEEIKKFTFAESTQIFDRTGKVKLYEVYGDEHRKIVPINKVSPNFISAVLAAEDDQFFSHPGLDFGGILMAVCHEVSKKVHLKNFGGLCPPRGGSTLTQQLIKNVILSNERTVSRKVKEWFLSRRIEKFFSKNEILELYVNQVSFGAISGIEIAAETFFNTSAKDLTIAQSAILAAVIRKPTFYSPWGNHVFVQITVTEEEIEKLKLKTRQDVLDLKGITVIDGLLGKTFPLYEGKEVFFPGRADWILERMKNLGFIRIEQYKIAQNELKKINFKKFRTDIKAPHFVMYVRELLEEKFDKEILEKGGLKVITTLDWDKQKKAEEIITEIATKNEENFATRNAALLSVSTKTGEIITMIGSRNFWDTENDGNVNVLLQKRLPGSAFKPIVFAAGFLAGLSPSTVLFDSETDFGQDWIPQNYDGEFRGPVSLRQSLGHSLNIPSVKVCIIAGFKKVYELAKKMGIQLDREADFYGNAIALGGGEVKGIDLANAFSIFANNGQKIDFTPFLEIIDRKGNILFKFSPTIEKEQILDEQVAFLINDILSDPENRGEGWNKYLQLQGRINASKTGTSNKRVNNVPYPFDTWTIGYTPQLTTVVWAGNSDGKVLNHSASGFNTASPIWKSFMEVAHQDLPIEEFTMPEKIKIIPVSLLSGKLPLEGTDEKLIIKEKFADFAVPTEHDDALTIIEVEKVSGKLPNQFTPLEALEKRAILNFHSFYPQNSDWEEPVIKWVEENGREFVAEFGVEKFLAELPNEESDLYTEKTSNKKPQVKFDFPQNLSTVTPPKIDVFPNITAKNGLLKTQFFWNGEFKKEIKPPQKSAVLYIPYDLKKNSLHKIKVVALDQLYYSNFAEIEVKIGGDNTPPEIDLIFPSSGEILQTGSTVNFLVNSFDKQSSISKVEFLINDKKIGTLKKRPFSQVFALKKDINHLKLQVKAFDFSGNSNQLVENFAVENKSQNINEFKIISPLNNSRVNKGETIKIAVTISSEMVPDFEKLIIFADSTSSPKTAIAQFNKKDLNQKRIFYSAFLAGNQDIEFSAKVYFAGKNFFSNKVNVVVR